MTSLEWEQGGDVMIQGYGDSTSKVIELMGKLQGSSAYLLNPRLDHITQRSDLNNNGVEFRVVCGVKP